MPHASNARRSPRAAAPDTHTLLPPWSRPAPPQRVMPRAPKSPAAVAAKLSIDQFMFAPICTAVFYFYKVVGSKLRLAV